MRGKPYFRVRAVGDEMLHACHVFRLRTDACLAECLVESRARLELHLAPHGDRGQNGGIALLGSPAQQRLKLRIGDLARAEQVVEDQLSAVVPLALRGWLEELHDGQARLRSGVLRVGTVLEEQADAVPVHGMHGIVQGCHSIVIRIVHEPGHVGLLGIGGLLLDVCDEEVEYLTPDAGRREHEAVGGDLVRL